MPDEVSAVTKTYDLLLWLLPHICNFTRQHRFTLGDRIEQRALDLLELLVEATYTRDKRELLRKANLTLEQLRYLMRLSKDLKQLSVPQYEFATRSLMAIGIEVGGWIKQQSR